MSRVLPGVTMLPTQTLHYYNDNPSKSPYILASTLILPENGNPAPPPPYLVDPNNPWKNEGFRVWKYGWNNFSEWRFYVSSHGRIWCMFSVKIGHLMGYNGPVFKFNHQRRWGLGFPVPQRRRQWFFRWQPPRVGKPREMPCHSARSKDNLLRPGETYCWCFRNPKQPTGMR